MNLFRVNELNIAAEEHCSSDSDGELVARSPCLCGWRRKLWSYVYTYAALFAQLGSQRGAQCIIFMLISCSYNSEYLRIYNNVHVCCMCRHLASNKGTTNSLISQSPDLRQMRELPGHLSSFGIHRITGRHYSITSLH